MNLDIRLIVNAPVSSNCFVIFDKAIGRNCIIVDPGSRDDSELFQLFQKESLEPEFIILTHEHFDHCAGCIEMFERYRTPVICSRKCSQRYHDRKGNLSVFRDGVGFECKNEDIWIENIDNKLKWNNYEISFYNTGGHTDSSLSFVIGNALFTGDTLIKDLKTVVKLKSGSVEDLKKTFDLYKGLMPFDLTVFPGHGETFILKDYDLKKAI